MKKQKKEKPSKSDPAKKVERQSTPPAIVFFSLVLIILVGVLCYSNSLHAPFVYDDRDNIVKHEGVHLDNLSFAELDKLKETLMKESRPVVRVSFALNYYFGGLNTFGYHLVNIFIHLMSAILVYLFLELTLNLPLLQDRYGRWAQDIALLSGLFFVAHPVQTQAVTYIVQRMASMAALFYLAALYFYAKARMAKGKMRISYFVLCTLATLFALGSKENSGTLPFFIILYEYFFLQSGSSKKAKKNWCYLIVGMVLVLGLMVWAYDLIDFIEKEYKKFPFTPGQRMLTELRVVTFYVSQLLAPLPSRLSLTHHFPLSYSLLNSPQTLICLVFVLGIIISSIYLYRKRPLISFALLWFWGNLVLESSFLPLHLMFEHRLYLPSIGFFLLVSVILVRGIEKLRAGIRVKKMIKTGGLLALIVPLSIMTYLRNEVWRDRINLWQDAARKAPQEIVPSHNLAYIYKELGMLEEAIAQYKITLELDPEYRGGHNNLGNIYFKQGKFEQAITEYLEEIKHYPDADAGFYFNLAKAYASQGLYEKAISEYKKAIALAPEDAKVYNALGLAFVRNKMYREAEETFLKILIIDGDSFSTREQLGNVYYLWGMKKKAIDEWKKALIIDPHNKALQKNLEIIVQQLK